MGQSCSVHKEGEKEEGDIWNQGVCLPKSLLDTVMGPCSVEGAENLLAHGKQGIDSSGFFSSSAHAFAFPNKLSLSQSMNSPELLQIQNSLGNWALFYNKHRSW